MNNHRLMNSTYSGKFQLSEYVVKLYVLDNGDAIMCDASNTPILWWDYKVKLNRSKVIKLLEKLNE